MARTLSPLFTWRSAIASEHGPRSTVRLVLLTLSLHMSERGDSCFPSLETLAMESGMSKSACSKLLSEAHEAGWIEKAGKGGRKQSGAGITNRYIARVPEEVTLLLEQSNLQVTLLEERRNVVPQTTKDVIRATEGGSKEPPSADDVSDVEPTPPAKTVIALMFEAFEDEVGRKPLTSSERGKWARGFRELAEAGVLPEHLSGICKEYRRKFADAELNPRALAVNLSAVAHRAKPPRDTQADRVRRIMDERGIA